MQTDPRPSMPHQQAALDFLATRDHAALFMEMRLGKTLVAIRSLVRQEAERVLIVCPLSVVGAWERELKLEGVAGVSIRGSKSKRAEALVNARSEGVWCLMGYESLQATEEVTALRWDAVILDESTRIKGPRSKITKLCLTGFQDAKHRLILSGLPAPESPMDYYNQLAFVRGGDFMGCRNFWEWRARLFRTVDPNGWKWAPHPDTSEAIAEHAARDAFVLDRKAAGIGEAKIHEERTVTMTHAQRKAFLLARDEFTREVEGETEMTPLAVTRFTWMQRIAGGMSADGEEVISEAKFRELLDLLSGELKGEQVVVFFRFNAELSHAAQFLRRHDVDGVAHIWGDTQPDRRTERINGFRLGEIRVLLLQEAVAQFGIDLSASSTAIYFSNSYSYEMRAQSEDRIVHPKKDEPLLYLDLITEKSTDALVLRALKRKEKSSRWIIDRILRSAWGEE